MLYRFQIRFLLLYIYTQFGNSAAIIIHRIDDGLLSVCMFTLHCWRGYNDTTCIWKKSWHWTKAQMLDSFQPSPDIRGTFHLAERQFRCHPCCFVGCTCHFWSLRCCCSICSTHTFVSTSILLLLPPLLLLSLRHLVVASLCGFPNLAIIIIYWMWDIG